LKFKATAMEDKKFKTTEIYHIKFKAIERAYKVQGH
jgi:hypothetical protein